MSALALTVVIPVGDQRAAIPEQYLHITSACDALRRDYELLYVDDGSRDGTADILDALIDEDTRVRVIHLRRPFGRAVALAAGFSRARGELVVTLEPGQDDAALIADFVARLDAGADVVAGWRQRPGKSGDLRSAVVRKLAAIELHDPSCGLRAYRGAVLRALPDPPGGERFLPLLAHLHGFRVEELVVHPREPVGAANQNGGFLAALADVLQVVLLTRHRNQPLRLLAVPGLLISGVGGVFLLLAAALGSLWLLTFGLPLALFGGQLVIAGVLAESITGTRPPDRYAIREEREAGEHDESEAPTKFHPAAHATPRPSPLHTLVPDPVAAPRTVAPQQPRTLAPQEPATHHFAPEPPTSNFSPEPPTSQFAPSTPPPQEPPQFAVTTPTRTVVPPAQQEPPQFAVTTPTRTVVAPTTPTRTVVPPTTPEPYSPPTRTVVAPAPQEPYSPPPRTVVSPAPQQPLPYTPPTRTVIAPARPEPEEPPMTSSYYSPSTPAADEPPATRSYYTPTTATPGPAPDISIDEDDDDDAALVTVARDRDGNPFYRPPR